MTKQKTEGKYPAARDGEGENKENTKHNLSKLILYTWNKCDIRTRSV
jgi:hypothetical protein